MNPAVDPPPAESPVVGAGPAYISLFLSVVGWIGVTDPPRRFGVDALYQLAVFGWLGAVGVGLGLRAVRVGRPKVLGWLAVVLGSALCAWVGLVIACH